MECCDDLPLRMLLPLYLLWRGHARGLDKLWLMHCTRYPSNLRPSGACTLEVAMPVRPSDRDPDFLIHIVRTHLPV
jgi:hypothetical protein